jgi:hypothetical protein
VQVERDTDALATVSRAHGKSDEDTAGHIYELTLEPERGKLSVSLHFQYQAVFEKMSHICKEGTSLT